jgi:FkbM family methyltransferase
MYKKLTSSNTNHQYKVGSSSWLLKETSGATVFDKFILSFIKGLYIGMRILIRTAVGKKRRDRFYVDNGIGFSDFLYNCVDLLQLDGTLLIVFDVPRYNYKFYSRITRKVENFLIHDVYASMSSHEDDILQSFSPTDGDVVIDVGAAFGFYTILSSMKVGPRGKVVAIEAQPDSFEMLNRNIKLNGLENVITLNYAAYSSEMKLKLYSGYTLMQERTGANNKHKSVDVRANTLDYLVTQLAQIIQVHWIKIDVEGAELEVLRGAHNILSNSKDIKLLIEIHGRENYDSIRKVLDSYGFIVELEKSSNVGNKHVILRKNPDK